MSEKIPIPKPDTACPSCGFPFDLVYENEDESEDVVAFECVDCDIYQQI